MGRGEPGDSYLIINEWGGVWGVLDWVRAVPELQHGQSGGRESLGAFCLSATNLEKIMFFPNEQCSTFERNI
jgi:hypothetical protein